MSYLKILFIPNEEGFPPYTVIRDDGDLREPEKRTAFNGPTHVVKEVAAFLADCEGGI